MFRRDGISYCISRRPEIEGTDLLFKKGDRVVCINEDMGATGSVLVKGKTYTVKEYNSPEEYAKLLPNEKHWQENGGRVMLEPDSLEWYGRRFKKVA